MRRAASQTYLEAGSSAWRVFRPAHDQIQFAFVKRLPSTRETPQSPVPQGFSASSTHLFRPPPRGKSWKAQKQTSHGIWVRVKAPGFGVNRQKRLLKLAAFCGLRFEVNVSRRCPTAGWREGEKAAHPPGGGLRLGRRGCRGVESRRCRGRRKSSLPPRRRSGGRRHRAPIGIQCGGRRRTCAGRTGRRRPGRRVGRCPLRRAPRQERRKGRGGTAG